MHLAEQLGASVETAYGEDVPYQIAEFARLSGVSKIVIGRSTTARKGIFGKPVLTERLIAAAPNLDIHVIPDASAYEYRPGKGTIMGTISIRDVGKSILDWFPCGKTETKCETVRPGGIPDQDSAGDKPASAERK